jgi:DNA-binding phage protein
MKNWQKLIIQLKKVADRKKITNTDLAKRTGYWRESISRLFSGKNCPSLDMFLKICESLGYEVHLKQKQKDPE